MSLSTLVNRLAFRLAFIFSSFVGPGFLAQNALHAQATVPCPQNIGFEDGNLGLWECWLGEAATGTPANGVTFSMGFLSGPQPTRHILQTATTPPTLDPYGHFPVVPTGGATYALKLGRDSANYAAER